VFNDLFFRLRSLFRRGTVESEADTELRFHFDQQVEKYLKSGLTREEAIRRARLDFGGHEQLKEEIREARGVNLLEALFQDIRYGLRIRRWVRDALRIALRRVAFLHLITFGYFGNAQGGRPRLVRGKTGPFHAQCICGCANVPRSGFARRIWLADSQLYSPCWRGSGF
jgi:hypothetical protein